VHSRTVGSPDETADIIEIRGADGAPPYVVRHHDGREGLLFPGADATVEHVEARDRA
jgi:hypothetical protein